LEQFPVYLDFTDRKQRYDQINEHKAPLKTNAEASQWQGQNVMSTMDSNWLHEDSVEKWHLVCPKRHRDINNEELKEQIHLVDLGQSAEFSPSPKCQQDIDNEKLKEQIRPAIIDLEQCQDSSLRPVEVLQFSDSPTAERHWETIVKIADCGSSETSVKTHLDYAAETLPNKSSVFMHSSVVDLCQVEPLLEKGSVEAQISAKTAEDHAIKVEDVFELESSTMEDAVEEEKEVRRELTHAVILQDVEYCQVCDDEMDLQRRGRTVSHTFPPDAGVEDVDQRTTESSHAIKRQYQKTLTERQHDWEKAQKSASNFFPAKRSRPLLRPSHCLDFKRILPWLLPSKHRCSDRSAYHIFVAFFISVCF